MNIKFDNNYKVLFYALLILTGIVLWFSISTCSTNKNKSTYLFDKWLTDSTKNALEQKKNSLGETTATSKTIELTKDEMYKYINFHPEIQKELANKYKTTQTIIQTITEFRTDTIKIPVAVHDSIPCEDFVKDFPVKERFYSFNLNIKNKKGIAPDIRLTSVVIPDSTTVAIGINKYGFLNLKRDYVTETRHSNKYITVIDIKPIVTGDINPHIIRNTSIGAGIGAIIASVFLYMYK